MVWFRFWVRLRGLAVVLPLVLAALFPVGVMPGQDQDGQTVMVLCSGDGPMLMVLDPVTGAFHKAPASGKSACHWAAGPALAALPTPQALPVPVLLTRRAALPLSAALWQPAHDPRGIFARGPPIPV